MRICIATLLAIMVLDAASAEPKPRGTLVLHFDNDTFTGQDDHYTSGVVLGLVCADLNDFAGLPLPAWMSKGLRRLPGIGRDDRIKRLGLSLGQHLFTPSELEAEPPGPDDLPYSAHLLATATVSGEGPERLDGWSLVVGTVGSAAFGRPTQQLVHTLTNSTIAEGWDYQMGSEVVVNLGYEHRHRLWRAHNDAKQPRADLIYRTSVQAGTHHSTLTLGLQWRLGMVPDDLAFQARLFGDELLGVRSDRARGLRPWSVHGMASLDATLIAHAFHLDGSLFDHDDPQVDHDHLRLRAQAGIELATGRWGFLAALVLQRIPWTPPDDRRIGHFGSARLTYRF